ncbi:hypothetical protein AALP_AA3G069800 [Arabis alpina]|uniref:Uncharacterized protein n=1 Tax=Arabis alpina TaxID=50452 RepID=A0A087H7K2_ARAAL|nr:hypothetical protein AALP_AA3G069800 [Arabis alpina]
MEWLRGFRADYGIPVMVVVWTCISYIPWKRPLVSLNPWPPQNLAQQSSSVDNPMRSPRDSSFQRCYPTISHAHKRLGNTETPVTSKQTRGSSAEEAYQQMLSSDTPRACSDSGSQTVTNAKGFSLQAWETQISVRYRDISQDYIASGKSQARKTYYSYHINLR